MALKVIGAGLGRTGTMSLKAALEQLLGGKCYHMYEVFEHLETDVPIWHDAAIGKPVDWEKLFDGYVAAVDWPAGAYWKEISAAYPNALILLSSRDSEKWWASASETIFPSIQEVAAQEHTPWHEMIDAMMTSRFHHDLNDKDKCIAAFEKHNENARKNAPANRFIEWQPGDGWEPICNALGLPVPDEPFPHVNSKEEFLQRIRDRKAAREAEVAAKS